jgi:nucleotide-binding universal stress UspA family protein
VRALVWIAEDTWQATVAQAAAGLPAGADVTLLHVADIEAESVLHVARQALLGRSHGSGRADTQAPAAISAEAAEELLGEAQLAFGRPARTQARRGRVEREVVAAAEGMDLLILARDGDCAKLGPRSLGPHGRFVVDHAPCPVLLIWPGDAPAVAAIPPPPHARPAGPDG